MKTVLQIASIKLFVIVFFIFSSINIIGQENNFVGTKKITEGNKSIFQTIPQKNSSTNQSFAQIKSINISDGKDKFVLDGNVLWSFQDGAAIANVTELNSDGTVPLVGWGLNNMRVSRYNDVNNVPQWEHPTLPYDPNVDVSDDGSVIAVTQGTDFYLLDNLTGAIIYQMTLPDTLYATQVSVSRDASQVVFLAEAFSSGTTAIAYAFDLTGSTPVIDWTLEVSKNEIINWAGVNFSASGTKIVINGRNHIYVLNSSDGSVIWDRFVDNTESPAVISGDGSVIVTADNSGFIQTRIFNSTTNEYDLLWQYRVPVGAFTNWASSVDISADGNTIVAGTLIFYSTGFDGSIIAFDTYGGGSPKWINTGAGDLVDDIALSDDGKVCAVVTWGDLAHAKPDLFVFDVQTGNLAYEVVSPGSFFTVDISHDGKRIFAGGKAVHAREFGSGGLAFLVQVDLGGGSVSGNVSLTGATDNSGVILKAVGIERTAVSDSSGNYIIKNIPEGIYTIRAEKPGYQFDDSANVNVVLGDTTSGVNFNLAMFLVSAPVLSASTNMPGAIVLNWIIPPLLRSMEKKIEIAKAVGDVYPNENLLDTKSVVDNFSTEHSNIQDFSFNGFVDSVAIYRSLVAGGPYIKIASTSSIEINYSDSSVFPLRDYYYVVNIFSSIGQSIYSNEVVGKVSDSLLTFDFVVPPGNIPSVDGIIQPGEWDDAIKIDVSDVFGYSGGTPKPQGSVYLYFKFDDDNDLLYVAGEDFLNTVLDNNEGFGFYFDDNNNNTFEPNGALPVLQEGNFWAYWHPSGSDLRFRKIFTGGAVGDVTTLQDAQLAFTDGAGYVQGEVAIPMGFHDGYQLQVYGPDKKVALGGFMIARNAGAALFDGWWPQTMNSVFNPQYFGDVKIDVSLSAPPQIPSNIAVNRQDNNLLVTFDNPTLGLNNEPLIGTLYKNLYKNGAYLSTINEATVQYLDQNVLCGAWYEYAIEAFTVDGTDTLMGPRSIAYGQFACQEPLLTQIKYDDDSWEAFYVVDFTFNDNKFALRFTPTKYPARVVRLQTLVNGNGSFDFTIAADSIGWPGKIIAGPYRVSSGVVGNVAPILLTLPGEEPPTIDVGDFWAVINYLPATPGEPGIGTDVNPPNSGRGMYYTSALGWQNFTGGNLMISAFITDQVVGVDDETNSNLPVTYSLKQNYPNPFNPITTIKYQLPEQQFVKVEIFNSIGEVVNTIVNQNQNAGEYSVVWNGKNSSGQSLASGIYIYRIKAGSFVEVKKMMMLK
jgi:FlgD Ig-like domain/Carboxypeptidase regulatory-like domain/PQQ-like domain